MVSLAQPGAMASAYRFESRMDIRRFRGVLTYSHGWFCTASTLRAFAVPAHSRVCRRNSRDNSVRLGRRRPAWRCARGLSRPQAVDDSRDPGLFRIDRPERALLELAVLCGASLCGWSRYRLGMGDRGIDHG